MTTRRSHPPYVSGACVPSREWPPQERIRRLVEYGENKTMEGCSPHRKSYPLPCHSPVIDHNGVSPALACLSQPNYQSTSVLHQEMSRNHMTRCFQSSAYSLYHCILNPASMVCKHARLAVAQYATRRYISRTIWRAVHGVTDKWKKYEVKAGMGVAVGVRVGMTVHISGFAERFSRQW